MKELIETKFLRFERSHPTRLQLTMIYVVTNKVTNSLLGELKWYPPFRKYAFFPEQGLVFDAACLQDIQSVLNQMMEHRAEQKELQRMQ